MHAKPSSHTPGKPPLAVKKLQISASSAEDLAGQILVGNRYHRPTFITQLRKGLPISSIRRVKKLIGDLEVVLRAISVSRRSYLRWKRDNRRLSPIVSDRLYRLARIEAEVISVFGDEDSVTAWLKTPNRALNDIPFRLLDTEIGTEQVKKILGRIEYGVYS